MNGASEALLQELIDASKEQTSLLRNLASKSTLSSGGKDEVFKSAASNVKSLNNEFNLLTLGVKGLSFGISAASTVIGALAGATVGVTGILIDFGKSAENGKATIANITGALSRLPGPFGMVASAATFAANVLETNVATQQKLANSGAAFGGSLTQMRDAASRSYLSLDEFATLVSKNGDVFRTMGGNVQSGVNQFTAIQGKLMKGEYAANLASLGYSMKDAADLTASYMRSQGSMNKEGLQDANKMAASVAQYGQELSMLSQLTGESREALQKKMDEENQEAQWQAMLATMSPEKAEKLRQGMQLAMAQGGKGAVDAFKAMAMGLPPMTEQARLYTATQQAGVRALENYNQNANNAAISTKESARLNRQTLARQIAEAGQDQQKLTTVLRASTLSGGELAKVFADSTKLQTSFMKDGKMLSEAEIDAQLEKMETDAKQKETEAAAAQEMQKATMDIANQILAKMMPAFNFLLDVTLKAATFLGKLVDPILNFGTDLINKVIVPAFTEIFGAIDPSAVMKPITDFFNGLFGGAGGEIDFSVLKDMVVKIIKPIAEFVKGVVSAINFEAIGASFRSVFGKIGTLFSSLSNVFSKVFGGAGGSESATKLGKAITDFFTIVGNTVGIIIDTITWIVNSPFGKFIFSQLKTVFEFFIERITEGIEVISGIVTIVQGIFKFFSGDFSGGLETIKEGFKKTIGAYIDFFISIKDYILGTLKNVWDLIGSAVKGIWESILNGIKQVGKGIWNWLTGSKEESPKELKPAVAQPKAPAATAPPVSPAEQKAKEEQKAKDQQKAVTEAAKEQTKAQIEEAKPTDPMESIKLELATLNKNINVLVAFTKEATILSKENVTVLKSLNRNLYPN